MSKESFLIKHRKGLVAAVIITGGITSLFVPTACSKEVSLPNHNNQDASSSTTQKTVLPENQLKQAKTSLWEDYNFASIIEGLKDGKYAVIQTFLKNPNDKSSIPPFYKYTQTLQYNTFYMEFNNPHQLSPVAQEFKQLGFINLFLAYGLIPQGARTYKDGQIVAEARLLKGGKAGEGIEIEEFHYGLDGKVIFNCKSQFDKQLNKTGQTDEVGAKKNEYYFMWTTTRN
jgi:hypothetical protein